MAKMAIYAIILSQYVSKKGNASLDLYDLELSNQIRVSLQDGLVLDESSVANKNPRNLILDGVTMRTFENRMYLTATNVTDQAVPERPSREKAS